MNWRVLTLIRHKSRLESFAIFKIRKNYQNRQFLWSFIKKNITSGSADSPDKINRSSRRDYKKNELIYHETNSDWTIGGLIPRIYPIRIVERLRRFFLANQRARILPAPLRLLQRSRKGRGMGSMLFWFDFYSEMMKGRCIDSTQVINFVFEEQEKIQWEARYVAIAGLKLKPCLSLLCLARR